MRFLNSHDQKRVCYCPSQANYNDFNCLFWTYFRRAQRDARNDNCWINRYRICMLKMNRARKHSFWNVHLALIERVLSKFSDRDEFSSSIHSSINRRLAQFHLVVKSWVHVLLVNLTPISLQWCHSRTVRVTFVLGAPCSYSTSRRWISFVILHCWCSGERVSFPMPGRQWVQTKRYVIRELPGKQVLRQFFQYVCHTDRELFETTKLWNPGPIWSSLNLLNLLTH